MWWNKSTLILFVYIVILLTGTAIHRAHRHVVIIPSLRYRSTLNHEHNTGQIITEPVIIQLIHCILLVLPSVQ